MMKGFASANAETHPQLFLANRRVWKVRINAWDIVAKVIDEVLLEHLDILSEHRGI